MGDTTTVVRPLAIGFDSLPLPVDPHLNWWGSFYFTKFSTRFTFSKWTISIAPFCSWNLRNSPVFSEPTIIPWIVSLELSLKWKIFVIVSPSDFVGDPGTTRMNFTRFVCTSSCCPSIMFIIVHWFCSILEVSMLWNVRTSPSRKCITWLTAFPLPATDDFKSVFI